MGRCYKRKTCRASWTAEALNEAMSKVTSKELGINKASREYGIPSRTLRRHLASGKGKGPLGRCPELSFEYEKKTSQCDARHGPSISIPNETSEPSSIESQKISYSYPKISDSSKSADEKKEMPSKENKQTPTQKTTKEKENHGEQTKKKKQVIKNKRKIGKNNQRKIKKKKRQPSYSSESQEEDIKIASSSDQTDVEENACVECLEDYNITKRQVDWIQCTRCLKWLH
ncbi:unnamed protein product [Euphydryas editha]|uniref:HTH psq-type domain-containing protein n=1 Tax=Euphydryas editha TaxID=104508 RepID=A0AAU9TLC7_EUPED|nr:unnamed protein product [Euphydryas editha]